jgi:hypothetical protein
VSIRGLTFLESNGGFAAGELIAQNKPFKIETDSGRLFEVPHRDFVSFSTRKTSLIISYEENGTEHFAILPLLTITAAMARA